MFLAKHPLHFCTDTYKIKLIIQHYKQSFVRCSITLKSLLPKQKLLTKFNCFQIFMYFQYVLYVYTLIPIDKSALVVAVQSSILFLLEFI